jgi:hypothetical protein
MTIYRHFPSLCESILEASTAVNQLTGSAGSMPVIRAMHSRFQLAHDAEWRQIATLKFSDIKDIAGNGSNAYVLIIGEKGTAGIMYINRYAENKKSGYVVIASDGGEPQELKTFSSKDITQLLKQTIGKTKQIYTTYQHRKSSEVATKRKERGEFKKQTTGFVDPKVTLETNTKLLLNKFRPLWNKALQSAIADVKGVVTTMIKNDAFEAAERKINKLKRLEKMIYLISSEEDNDDLTVSMGNFLSYALYMSASYYYPDLTGEVSGNPNAGYYGNKPSAQSTKGVEQLIADIAAGDNSKLAAILTFFKRGLIS